MCGRFALGIPYNQIAELHGYNVQVGEWVAQEHFHPRYNVAPRSYAPVIRRDTRAVAAEAASNGHESSEKSDQVIMHTMKWGLVPHWSKHDDGNLNTINARCEALVEGGGMWNSIKGKKRCAIPCQGYYEWLKKGKERLPHFTKRGDGNLMLLAGLYDCVTLEGQTEPLWTFTIVTTDANKDFSWLHDRQPVILPTTDTLNTWLDTSSGSWNCTLTKLVQPYHDEKIPLTCYQVPKEVGKVGNESPTFIEPLSQRRDGIEAMFAKQSGPKPSPSNSQISSAKRKLDDSAVSQPSPSPRKKAHKMNTWGDDSDIEYIDSSLAGSSTKVSRCS
ncbi:hypothetical protein BDY19DRAFT_1011352 [Irpex rosettiformis]|uniref:Uncharacterized protein n=1 Tax=Irpex rosettiformis TaxID=378272 RepID=A0ACB8U028_9APHY|nr:hypothetical protein BDY19DRAFT_1011352 [Irpex rosettiformis]